MIEKLAWNTFKKTGDINTYLEYKKLKDTEKKLRIKIDETVKGEWNNISRT